MAPIAATCMPTQSELATQAPVGPCLPQPPSSPSSQHVPARPQVAATISSLGAPALSDVRAYMAAAKQLPYELSEAMVKQLQVRGRGRAPLPCCGTSAPVRALCCTPCHQTMLAAAVWVVP